jgi:hypothetical protein
MYFPGCAAFNHPDKSLMLLRFLVFSVALSDGEPIAETGAREKERKWGAIKLTDAPIADLRHIEIPLERIGLELLCLVLQEVGCAVHPGIRCPTTHLSQSCVLLS